MSQAVGNERDPAVSVAAPSDLLERAGAGDEESWHQLVEQHLSLVRSICAAYGLEADAAAQVNQVVWLQLAELLPRIRLPEAVGGWIAAATRASCVDARWSPQRSGYATARLVGAAAPAPDVRVRRHDPVAAFARVGARCQRLLRLVATSPRPSDDDVSAALDLTAADVATSCARCLRRLGRMTGTPPDDVLIDLREAVAAGDGPLGDWRAAAHFAFAWVLLDVPYAERVYESKRPFVGLGGGRSGGAELGVVHQARFAVGFDGVEVTVEVKGDDVVMTGEVGGGVPAKVVARWPGGEQVDMTDETGAFRFHDLPRAPLCIQLDGSVTLKTGWIVP